MASHPSTTPSDHADDNAANRPAAGGDLESRPDRSIESDGGRTTIVDAVVAKVAGIAAREIPGVYAMGGGAARALGNVTSRVGLGDDRGQGVSVEVGQREAAADLVLVVEYGESIQQVCDEVRANVKRRIEGICGLKVTEVNIIVNDLHFPGDDESPGGGSTRVQ